MLRADALLGCDGVHSAVRKCMHAGGDGLRFCGAVTFWGGTELVAGSALEAAVTSSQAKGTTPNPNPNPVPYPNPFPYPNPDPDPHPDPYPSSDPNPNPIPNPIPIPTPGGGRRLSDRHGHARLPRNHRGRRHRLSRSRGGEEGLLG